MITERERKRAREDVREKRRGHIHIPWQPPMRFGGGGGDCTLRVSRDKKEKGEKRDGERKREKGRKTVKLYHESSMTRDGAAGSVLRVRGTTTRTTATTTKTDTHARHHRHRHSMTSYHRRQHGADVRANDARHEHHDANYARQPRRQPMRPLAPLAGEPCPCAA